MSQTQRDAYAYGGDDDTGWALVLQLGAGLAIGALLPRSHCQTSLCHLVKRPRPRSSLDCTVNSLSGRRS